MASHVPKCPQISCAIDEYERQTIFFPVNVSATIIQKSRDGQLDWGYAMRLGQAYHDNERTSEHQQ